MGIVRDPDASASWLTLANNYLHPGGGPPLIGTEDLMFDVASIAIAAACLLVAFSFIYLFDRV